MYVFSPLVIINNHSLVEFMFFSHTFANMSLVPFLFTKLNVFVLYVLI